MPSPTKKITLRACRRLWALLSFRLSAQSCPVIAPVATSNPRVPGGAPPTSCVHPILLCMRRSRDASSIVRSSDNRHSPPRHPCNRVKEVGRRGQLVSWSDGGLRQRQVEWVSSARCSLESTSHRTSAIPTKRTNANLPSVARHTDARQIRQPTFVSTRRRRCLTISDATAVPVSSSDAGSGTEVAVI